MRGELEVSPARPRLYHLRDQDGRREFDIVAELGEERVIGFEIKAGASVTTGDARHLSWLRDELGDRFVAGAVLHTGRTPSRSVTGSPRSRQARRVLDARRATLLTRTEVHDPEKANTCLGLSGTCTA